MIVVADTGPLSYLVLVEAAHALPKLYGRVAVPPAVALELEAKSTPARVRQWIASPPDWLEVKTASARPSSRASLDEGEEQAIALALELQATALLIDDWEGRQAAQELGLRIIGTLGALLAAGVLRSHRLRGIDGGVGKDIVLHERIAEERRPPDLARSDRKAKMNA